MAQQKVEPVFEFKLILFGDGGTGKTTFIKQFKIKDQRSKIKRSQEKCVESQQHLLLFYTNKGAFQFICWDTSGEEKFGGCCESFFREAHCAIIMFDGTSQVTYKNVPSWQRDLEKARGYIPIVLCENKFDIKDGKVKAKYITSDEKKNLQYCGINTEGNYNLEKPLLLLARKLVGDPNLEFVEMPPLE